MNKPTTASLPAIMLLLAGLTIGGCSPTVRVEAPDKPITINMNIKIDHEIRVKVDKDIENVVGKRSDIF
ncbi:MAG: YnbE family lipoprotein [Chlorobiaceae bacterium]|nr:YnbE family lipoprotein [Chlorobiaceae bacterium]